MADTLVLIEHDSCCVRASSVRAITFAKKLGEFSLLILGYSLDKLIPSISYCGAKSVLVVDNPALSYPLADKYARVIASIARARGVRKIIASSSTFSKDVLPRTSALLDAVTLTDISSIERHDGEFVFLRSMYAGNVISKVRLNGDNCVLLIRDSAFDVPEKYEKASPVDTISITNEMVSSGVEFVSHESRQSERIDMNNARIVVAGGRPLKDRETFNRFVVYLADLLKGAVGATRAAVDLGIAPNNWQIGQTGRIIAPNLYIAIGISGSIQHVAGIRDAKVIVAINKDPDSPIFQVANYGLVGDLYEIVPAIIKAIQDKL